MLYVHAVLWIEPVDAGFCSMETLNLKFLPFSVSYSGLHFFVCHMDLATFM